MNPKAEVKLHGRKGGRGTTPRGTPFRTIRALKRTLRCDSVVATVIANADGVGPTWRFISGEPRTSLRHKPFQRRRIRHEAGQAAIVLICAVSSKGDSPQLWPSWDWWHSPRRLLPTTTSSAPRQAAPARLEAGTPSLDRAERLQRDRNRFCHIRDRGSLHPQQHDLQHRCFAGTALLVDHGDPDVAGISFGSITIDISSTWSDSYSTTDVGARPVAIALRSSQSDHRWHIYLCNNANPTTTEQSGGSLWRERSDARVGDAQPARTDGCGRRPLHHDGDSAAGISTRRLRWLLDAERVGKHGHGVGHCAERRCGRGHLLRDSSGDPDHRWSYLSVQQRQPDHDRAIGWDSRGERSDARVGDAQPARTDGCGRRHLHHDGDPAAGISARRLWWLLDAERVRKHGHGVGHCAERWCGRGHLLRRGHQPGHESHGDYDRLGRSGQLR